MLKVAITGNIASGKSQVEKMLADRFPVYDTDKIAHRVVEKMDGFYGYDVFTDGKIDRKKLGEIVFLNPDLKKKLEEIVHPQVKEEVLKIFDQEQDFVFVSVPLLFETGFNNLFDKIIFVQCNDDIRLQRLMKRNNLTKEQALLRMNAQQCQEGKIEKSDYVIYNNGSLEELSTKLDSIINSIKS